MPKSVTIPRVLAAAVALMLLTLPASASPGRFHPELVEAVQQLEQARGPEAYAALRGVWRNWDRAHPLHVEEALRAAEQNPRISPAARVYAALLGAYARTRRGDLVATARRVGELGYVDKWLVVGPFDNEGKAGFAKAYAPELDLASPIVPGRAYSGKERPVRWRQVPDAFPYGFFDAGALVRPATKVCVYAKTFVSAAEGSRAPRQVTLWVGSGGAFKAFWNGEQVLSDTAYRGHDADRFATRVSLERGVNDLTLKLCGDEQSPVVSVRLGDARGGRDAKITFGNAIASSEQAAKTVDARVKELGPDAKPASQRGPLGPIDAFEKLSDGKNPKARDLHAYAKYLVATGGDDPTEHLARDLARRAAEQEPSVERLLLAGALAEDRNRDAEWLDKAAELAKKQTAPNVDVLLAQAEHARTSPNWRDAIPFIDRVLAADPDNVQAIHARVELYNEAGLRRTGLSTLQRAVERNPHSVNLLNMYASQLRALGRTTAAMEVENRYAALRFDDRTYINQMIDLAVKRRNVDSAERWVKRLLGLDPDSQWALGVAARTYRALGKPNQAIASYNRALELAPEDVGTLRTLADLQGELGNRDDQLALLRRILEIRPQDRAVREYVEHIEPPRPRADEAYAWASERFLKLRHAPAQGQNNRTLRDLTVSTVFPNGLGSRFRQVVYQPLTDAAAAMGRQYSFQYQADREVVQLRGARVFRGDGRVDEAIEYGEGAANNPAISMYTSARNFYVQLPRLEPGDVVELRYRIDDITPRNEFADYFGEVVYLQSSEPVKNAEYVLITPKSRTLHVDSQLAGLKQSVKEKGNQKIYRFFHPDVPAILPEPSMPPWPEVLGFVHVSTYASWKELGKWYWNLVKDQFDLDDETRKLARDIGKGAKTDLEKVRAVYGWVVENTRYVALEFGIYGYKPRRCVQTVARGWGDCKDKATVIVTLLEELGVDSTIVVLRSQLRGDFPSKLASLAPFDHAIVYVPSLDLYLDGTAEHAGATELPLMDLGAMGLLVNEGDSKLVHLPHADPEKNVVKREVVAKLKADGASTLEVDYLTRGTSAAEWRRRYEADGTRRERVNQDLGREFPGLVIADGPAGIVTSGLDDIEKPVRVQVKGTAPGFARSQGDQLSLAVTTGYRLTPNYASLSKRKQDVRILGFSTIDDTFVIDLPPGTTVVSRPPETSADTRFGKYSVQVEVKPKRVVVKSRLLVKATRISPKDYGAWKKFCREADQALSHPLVLKK